VVGRAKTNVGAAAMMEVDKSVVAFGTAGISDATDVNMDSEDGAIIGNPEAGTGVTSFVAVNAIVNVPIELVGSTSTCEPNCASYRTSVSALSAGSANAPVTSKPMISDYGRHGFVKAEIHKLLGTMELPWVSMCVFEAASKLFPEVDPTALQMTIQAVLMTQRQCVRELTLAGARKGPRCDENGEVFIELDLVYANRFSDSY